MAISTYSELKPAISDWMDRSDISGNAADFVTLAEARLNRILEGSEADATLTGTVDSRRISISALSVREPVALFIVNASGDERELVQKADGNFPYSATSGEPTFWAVDGTGIDFDCPLNAAYTFRFRYGGKLALSDAAPTSTFLTENPDIYLAASILWGSMFVNDMGKATAYRTAWDEFVAEHNYAESRKKRAILAPDPALAAMGSRRFYSTDGAI